MEQTYGIGVNNRYELFYDQDDVQDFETVINAKNKKKAKEPAQQGIQTPNPAVQQKSAAEKENKQIKKATLENGTGPQKASEPRRGIKEQQNNSNKDNSTVQRKDGDNKGPRPAFNKAGGENREERNNRRNREMNGNAEFEKPRSGGGAPGAGGSAVGQNRNANRRPFDGRKRERDRQSGSDKTGVKAVDKRDGAGAHNWGTHKQDIDDLNKPTTDDEQKEGGEETVEDAAPPAPVEEEPKEMTLDEWKAQRQAQLLQPQYNLRKAGEGESAAQWDKMKRLDKKPEESVGRKDDGGIGKKEVDGKKKQVLNIEFNFNDGRRGGLGRRPGGPGGRGGAPGGGERRNDRDRRPRPPRENADESQEGGNAGGENRERRPPRRPRFENRGRGDYHGHGGQSAPHAPKVDDERDFPSLG